jgi:hypothetical protein
VKKFNDFIDRFAKRTGAAGPVVLRKFTADALFRIISRTPVDTGEARYGWAAAGQALGIHVPKPDARAKNQDPGEYEENLTSKRMYIRIVNNVGHIMALEYGWSKQAPLGMVRITMAEMRSGQDIANDMAEEIRAEWNQIPARARYRSNTRVMNAILKERPVVRRPK